MRGQPQRECGAIRKGKIQPVSKVRAGYNNLVPRISQTVIFYKRNILQIQYLRDPEAQKKHQLFICY